MLRRELEYFFGAVRFFTRLPVPAWVGHDAEKLNHAARYFPLVGVLVGGVAALILALASVVLPPTLALILSMVATLLLTGAFHEDGFADFVDGFGGGWGKEQVLQIMKDSRVGSYGAVGIALLLLAKFCALRETPRALLVCALLAGHAFSRLASVVPIFAMEYVREDATSRAKPLAQRMSRGELALAAFFGLSPLALLPWRASLMGGALAAVTLLLLARYYGKRIGGYTGDCLGATQQLAELTFYFGIVAATWTST